MSRFGTGLSKLLYAVMIVGLGLALLGIIAAIVFAVVAMVNPDAITDGSVTLNGQPVYLRQLETALPIAAVMILACSFAGAVLWQLIGLLKSAAQGAPFVAANVRRLRVVAALFGALMIVQLASLLLPATASDMLNMREARLDMGTLLSALLSLVLAEVFKAGVALREDAEGTI